MSDIDLINSLGLGATNEGAANTETEATEVTSEAAEAATAPAKRTEIKIVGSIATSGVAALPARAPSGGGFGERGSKYPFDDLAAPTKDAEGNVTEYKRFTVLLKDVENADAKKLQAAIQAATAAQNKKHKDAGRTTYFVSRTELDDDGAYIGSSVYRVDDTIDAE